MYSCWIFLGRDPDSTQWRVGAVRILNSSGVVCSPSSVDNMRFMRHIEGQLLNSLAISPDSDRQPLARTSQDGQR
jgi:hypothetical protein